MTLIERFLNFFKRIFSNFSKSSPEENPAVPLIEARSILEKLDEAEANTEDRISVSRRTILTKLYMLEQEIVVFENSFPKEYKVFMEKIECLRKNYNSSLEEVDNLLTFAIDPEFDGSKLGEIIKLEKEIKKFIEREVKFDIISKRLMRLITKLNILYNVSIFHSKESDKEKVMSQLGYAIESAKKVAKEFKECYYLLADNQLKERIVNLISYADYEIFKANIRNSDKAPDILINNLIMRHEFDEFNYINAFVAFIKDELSDLGELLPLISNQEYHKMLSRSLEKLLTDLTYCNNVETKITDAAFWNRFISLESSVLEILKLCGVEKEKIKVRLIVRMDINIDESDVFILPLANTYLSLTSLYSITNDEKILLLTKLLRNVSNEVSYKEIYFLLILFDVIGIIKNNPNELIRHITKYLQKYPYEEETINLKKEDVKNSPNKEYVYVFTLFDYEKDLIHVLENLNFEFEFRDNKVFMNSFYFNGLETVQSSLQNNTNNMMT